MFLGKPQIHHPDQDKKFAEAEWPKGSYISNKACNWWIVDCVCKRYMVFFGFFLRIV